MVSKQIGSMHIRGTMDTQSLERGFNKTRRGFSNVKRDSKSVIADFARMSAVAGDVAMKLGGMATVGTGALAAFAAKAPQVAPALAKMSVTAQKLGFIVGEELAGSFEKGAQLFERFVAKVDNNRSVISGFGQGFIGTFEAMGSTIDTISTKVSNFLSSFGVDTNSEEVKSGIGKTAGAAAAGLVTNYGIKKLTGLNLLGLGARALFTPAGAAVAGAGALGYGAYKGLDYMRSNLYEETGANANIDVPTALGRKISGGMDFNEMYNHQFNGTASISPAQEDNRKWSLLNLWDSFFG